MSQKINFVPSNPGTATVPKFKSFIQKDGSIVLVQDGVRYLQDEIQSYEEMCNINNIVNRFLNGDTGALEQIQGIYADITKMPNDRQTALQNIMDAQRIFEELPSDIRARFNNSWENFYLSGDTDKFYNAIAESYGIKNDAVIPAEEKEN